MWVTVSDPGWVMPALLGHFQGGDTSPVAILGG